MNLLDVCSKAVLAACFAVVQAQGGSPEIQKVVASIGGSNDEFGFAVGVSDDVAVIGSPRDDSVNVASGSAYVFHFDSVDSRWVEVKQLVASDGLSADDLAGAVGVDGEFIVLGALGFDSDDSDTGAAYVYSRNLGGADNWGEMKQLLPSDPTRLARFGGAVAISGELIAVGAAEGLDGSGVGAVYLFGLNEGGVGNWGEITKLVASDGGPSNRFGGALALEGDRLVVGAPGESDSANNGGAAYVFERNQGGANNWGEVKKIQASDIDAGDLFGSSLDLNGDLLVVGATETGSAQGAGAAYVFDRNEEGANSWGQLRRLSDPNGTPGAAFGTAVAVSGDNVLIGAPQEAVGGLNAGLTYLYRRAGNWALSSTLEGTDTSANFRLGQSISISGNTILVGASGDDTLGLAGGGAYFFGVPSVPNLEVGRAGPDVVISWESGGANLGLESSEAVMPANWQPEAGANSPFTVNPSGSRYYRLVSASRLDVAFKAVGDPGNDADALTGLGSTGDSYRIGEFEVSNAEYVAFLNSVASSDPAGLYNDAMASSDLGGITRSGTDGAFRYGTKPLMGNKPVNFVSYFDALRFANWLHNGQPIGAQNGSTTEDGAYTFTALTEVGARNATALVWLPSEPEWYKAAYYDPTRGDEGGYWLNPTMSDELPELATADAVGDINNDTSNIANYGFNVEWNGVFGNVTSVGSGGSGSRSFYGPADMGGNVAEWNESPGSGLRTVRGGSWQDFESALESGSSSSEEATTENDSIGFRVARP